MLALDLSSAMIGRSDGFDSALFWNLFPSHELVGIEGAGVNGQSVGFG